MWKDYSADFIKHNRASSISIAVGALISALFLSFLCSLFYNFWTYENERVVLEEGDWQGRITGEITVEDLFVIQNFGNVKKAVVNKELSGEQDTVVDVYFQNARHIYRDMPLLVEQLGREDHTASYHESLLSGYLIHDPQDADPPLLMTFYLIILLTVALSLLLIIRNSFAMSMNARIRQFGIFSSIGATPAQIRTCLMQEAVMLCAVPVLLGNILGIALSVGVTRAMNQLAAVIPGGHETIFQYQPWVLAGSILISILTVLGSAWLPAQALSRRTPLEAIHYADESQLKKKRKPHILSLIFGVEGELAGNAIKAQRKALRTSTLSLTLSFLGFTWMVCFFTLSGISTTHTYFEKYQNVWDAMVTVKGTRIEDIREIAELQELEGVRDCTVYQKIDAVSLVVEEDISGELQALGGLEYIAGASVVAGDGSYLVNAPVVVLDDASFLRYCEQIGVSPRLDGGVVLNQIWDSLNSNFRYRRYIPFLNEHRDTMAIHEAGQKVERVDIPVIAYTEEAPALREAYDDYALVQFIPLSLWKTISGTFDVAGEDTYVRILANEGAALADIDTLEEAAVQHLSPNYELVHENRIRDKILNDYMIWGYQLLIGGFCFMLALIGIANVFSNTLGFLRQRKREFAQYASVGMTPEEMRKMFCIEALVMAGRPILITLPLTVAAVGFMIKASYLDPMEFIVAAPILPIFLFILVIFGFVSLAYYLGGRKVQRCNLSDVLRDDTVM